VTAKHAVVTFVLEGFPLDSEGIVNTRIEYFNQQNVLVHVAIETVPNGSALMLNGIFGVTGQIVARAFAFVSSRGNATLQSRSQPNGLSGST
jgi:hypothetical protein